MAVNWADIINSATTGAASIVAAAKGNYTKKENQLSLGTNVGVGLAQPQTGLQSALPLLLFGGLVFLVFRMFSKKRRY